MLETLERVASIVIWLFLLFAGLGQLHGWWVIETHHFQGIVLFVLSVLVIKGDE